MLSHEIREVIVVLYIINKKKARKSNNKKAAEFGIVYCSVFIPLWDQASID